jgi:hypothetical protein
MQLRIEARIGNLGLTENRSFDGGFVACRRPDVLVRKCFVLAFLAGPTIEQHGQLNCPSKGGRGMFVTSQKVSCNIC